MKVFPVAAIVAAMVGMNANAAPCVEGNEVHRCFQGDDRVSTCESAVAQDPLDLEARLALCQAYYRIDDFQKALQTVRGGLARCGGSRRDVCRRLGRAESNMEELLLTQNESQRMEIWMEANAARRYCLGPISNEKAIEQCEMAIAAQPKDPEVIVALARKLGEQSRPAEGLMVLGGLANVANAPDVGDLRTDLERRRRSLAEQCLSGGALETCAAAYLAGASDAVALGLQRFSILDDRGRASEALDLLAGLQEDYPGSVEVARAAYDVDGNEYAARGDELKQVKQRAATVLGIDAAKSSATAASSRDPGDDVEKKPASEPPPAVAETSPDLADSKGREDDQAEPVETATLARADSPPTPTPTGTETAVPDLGSEPRGRTFSNTLTADGRAY